MNEEKDVLAKLAEDPNLLGRALRSAELWAFKTEYGVGGSSKLRCPACNQYGQSGGSLWGPSSSLGENTYVCRKCRLVWRIECLTKPLKDVVEELRKATNPKKEEE